MRIQHNIVAMNAYRNFVGNNSSLSKNLEKLSSGYRINRAGDDAAGLAISEKMRAQISGLDTAQKNVKDGISLVKTAEGALQEVQDMMNRMVSLATQSANGTYDNDVDRQALQDEMDALLKEIDRISETANFNGINLLDGSLGTQIDVPAEAKLAFSQITASNVDGVAPSAATKALYQFTMGGTTTPATPTQLDGTVTNEAVDPTSLPATKATFVLVANAADTLSGFESGGTIDLNTGDIAALGALEVDANGTTLSDLFNIKVGGSDKDWGTDGSETLAGKTITLEAKSAGAQSTAVKNTLNGLTLTATAGGAATGSVSYTAGKDLGQGAAAPTAAKFELEIDLTQLESGQTLSIGGKTYEFTTDGSVGSNNAGVTNTAIQIGKGYATDAAAIKAALTGSGEVFDTTSAFAVTDNMTAVNAGGTTLELTFETTATGKGSAPAGYGKFAYTHGANNPFNVATTADGTDGGQNKSPELAEVTYTVDMSKLVAGSKLAIGGIELEIVADSATSLTANQIKVSDAQNDAKLEQAFIDRGYNKGTLDFNSGTLKITGLTAQKDGATLETENAVTFTNAPSKTAGVADADGNNFDITTDSTTYGTLVNQSVTLSDGTTKTLGELFDIKVGDATPATSDTFAQGATITFEAKEAGAMDSAVVDLFNSYTGVTNVSKNNGLAAGATNGGGKAASVAYSMTGEFRVGDEITINGKKATIVDDADVDVANGLFGKNVADSALSTYFTNGNATVNFSSGTVTITSTAKDGTNASDFATNTVKLDVKADRSVSTENDGLTLQIGDSVKETIEVKINDMGTDGLGIADLKGVGIKNRIAANKAIDTLKTAINTVSSQRGRLGAIQNRLEHTSNNLSVMEENITDAESAIRDTDMADEMTAYTKNNILVQAAQAMLAQANQQPQGVLQLLQ